MKFLAVIPARGGSKKIKLKNLIKIKKKPLIHYTISSAKKSKFIKSIIVSTDHKKIKQYSQKMGCRIHNRKKSLAGDFSSTHSVLKDLVKKLKISNELNENDGIIILQPTSPLSTYKHINNAVKLFKSDKKANSLVSVQDVPHNFEPFSQMRKNKSGYLSPIFKKKRPVLNRQKKNKTFARNGASIYITRFKNINKFIWGGKILPYMMSENDSLDLDDYSDLKKIKKIINVKNY